MCVIIKRFTRVAKRHLESAASGRRHSVSGVAADPGIFRTMGGPHLCEFEFLKSCALDVVEMDGRIYVQGLAGSWNIA